MSDTKIQSIVLFSADAALFVNGVCIISVEPDEDTDINEIANRLSVALGAPHMSANAPVPALEEWNWDDVYEDMESRHDIWVNTSS